MYPGHVKTEEQVYITADPVAIMIHRVFHGAIDNAAGNSKSLDRREKDV
jgi:hypothetical protein